jgi:hypothetical protein
MRLAIERRAGRRAIWLGIIAVTAASSLAWAWSVKSAHNPQVSAAEIIASRFPAEWIALTPKSAAAYLLAHAFSSEQTPREPAPPADPIDWLSQVLLFEQARQDLMTKPYSGMQIPRFEPRDNAAVSAMPVPRPGGRASPASLLNDAQIASIKERLNLTPDQQKLWPSVETALRAVAWRGNPDKLGSKSATLDPKGVEKLKVALIPFLKTLNAAQKDELRMIAHLMGLGQFASQP